MLSHLYWLSLSWCDCEQMVLCLHRYHCYFHHNVFLIWRVFLENSTLFAAIFTTHNIQHEIFRRANVIMSFKALNPVSYLQIRFFTYAALIFSCNAGARFGYLYIYHAQYTMVCCKTDSQKLNFLYVAQMLPSYNNLIKV